jgi:hypothetical protein
MKLIYENDVLEVALLENMTRLLLKMIYPLLVYMHSNKEPHL